MVEPGLVSLLNDFFGTYKEEVAHIAIVTVPAGVAFSLLRGRLREVVVDWYQNHHDPQAHLRKALDAVGLERVTAEEFHALTGTQPGGVSFSRLRKVLSDASLLHVHEAHKGPYRGYLASLYEGLPDLLHEKPYVEAVQAFLETPACRKEVTFSPLNISQFLPSRHVAEMLGFSIAGSFFLTAATASVHLYHYAPHVLYDRAFLGSMLGGAVGGVLSIAGVKGQDPMAKITRSRRFAAFLVAGLALATLSISVHLNEHRNQGYLRPKPTVVEATLSSASPSFVARYDGKELCRDESKPELSRCIIQKVGYFKPVDIYQVEAGKEQKLSPLTAEEL